MQAVELTVKRKGVLTNKRTRRSSTGGTPLLLKYVRACVRERERK